MRLDQDRENVCQYLKKNPEIYVEIKNKIKGKLAAN
jgi:hypothetical protein